MNDRIRIAALAALLTCSAAYAGDQATQAETMAKSLPEFSKVDANADGAISQDEAATLPELSSVWSEADADKNGKLSSKEYSEARKKLGK
jgi:hypothetical protein